MPKGNAEVGKEDQAKCISKEQQLQAVLRKSAQFCLKTVIKTCPVNMQFELFLSTFCVNG